MCKVMKVGWDYKTIGDIAFFQSGSRPKGGVGTIKEGVLSLGGEHIGKNGYISIATPKYVTIDFYTNNPKGHIEENDILLCKDGALTGKVAIVRKELQGCKAMINEHVFIIRTKHLLQKYLYYFLFSSKGQIQLKSRISGAAQGGLNGANFKTISVPYPLEKDEQQRIVEELDLLSGIIEKKKEQLKELDSLAQSIFYDMFGDPVTNEKGWEEKKLGEEFEVSSGGTPSTSKSEYWDNGNISWIGSNMCQNQVLHKNDGKFITKEGLEHSSAKLYLKGYVLVALVGATIGKVALLDFDTTTNQNIAGINVPNKKDYTSFFIFYLIQSLYYLFENIGEGKFKMANLSFIRALPIISPPLSLQQQFAEKVEAIEHQKELIKQSIKEVETLFNSRMDYYFDG